MGGHASPVGAASEAGDGSLDGVELVEDVGEVRDPFGPDRWEHRVVEPDAVATGAQGRGLDDHEPTGGPEGREGGVPVEVPPVAVGEHHNGEVGARGRGGHWNLQRHRAAGGGQLDGRDGDDRATGARDAAQRVDNR